MFADVSIRGHWQWRFMSFRLPGNSNIAVPIEQWMNFQDFEPIFEDGLNETVVDSKIKGRVLHEEHNHQVIELSYTLLVMVLWFLLLVYSFQTFIKVLGKMSSLQLTT